MALVALAVVGALVSGGAIAIDGPIFHEETVSVDNDTDSVAVTVTNVSNGPIDLTVSGVSNGTETVQNNTTIDATNGSTTKEFQVNSTKYDSYYVLLEESDAVTETQTVENVSVDVLSSGSGGGGFIPGASQVQSITILVIAALALLLMGDD